MSNDQMTDINKLCDDLELLKSKSHHMNYLIALYNADQPLIDAARESVKLCERIKELERELKERGG